MNRMKTVGIRDFRDNLADYTREEQPVQVTSYGRVVGYFIPAMSQKCVILCTQTSETEETEPPSKSSPS